MDDTVSRRKSFELLSRRTSLDERTKQVRRRSVIASDFAHLNGKLFDREEEEKVLQSAYRRTLSGSTSVEDTCQPECVLISGSSGTGKTALARTIQSSVHTSGGVFVQGKFDVMQNPGPCSAFVSAFSAYVDIVMQSSQDDLSSLRAEICNSVGIHLWCLVDIFPSIERIVGKQTHSPSSFHGTEPHSSLKSGVRLFVRAISSHERPLVLLLDDLQWADDTSLDLIETLVVAENETKGFMLIGTFRDNDLSPTHPLASMLDVVHKKSKRVSKISLSNLSDDAVNEMVSHLIDLPPERSQSLSDVVYSQTQGNAFFITQFMRSLRDQGILFIDEDDMNWQWNEESLHQFAVAGDVVDLVSGIMQKLCPQVISVLQVAACIGLGFDESSIGLVLEVPVQECLLVAVRQGLIQRDTHDGDFKFTHDKVQQAAYMSIPVDERSTRHLEIGRRLCNELVPDEEDEAIFVAVNQLNRGSLLIQDDEERISTAALNLQAGQKAMLSSAFAPAAVYFRKGIELLGQDPWGLHYELTLSLFNAAAEAGYCNAEFCETQGLVDEVVKNAESFQDKVRAYATQVYCFGAQNKLQKAIDTALEVLRELGESFPANPNNLHVLRELAKTRWMLRGKSHEKILRLPMMKHKDKVASMQLLNLLYGYTYLAWVEFSPLVVFRMIQLSMKYGLCTVSSYAFSAYGMIVSVGLNDRVKGHQFGLLGLSLLEKFNAKQWIPRVYAVNHGFLNHWMEPTRLSLEPLLYAHRIGLETGDIEFGMTCALLYTINAFDSGCSLNEQEEEVRLFYHQMVVHKQDSSCTMLRPRLQLLLNLRGKSKDPLDLTGEFMNEEESLQNAAAEENWMVVWIIHLVQTLLSFFFGDIERAAEMSRKCRKKYKLRGSTVVDKTYCFLDALIELSLAQKYEHKKWTHIGRAKKNLNRVYHWVRQCGRLSECPCIALMNAEMAAAKGNDIKAMDLYKFAIQGAGKDGLIHYEAIANELAGRFSLQRGLPTLASQFYKRAYNLYVKWGAQAKADHMKETTYLIRTDSGTPRSDTTSFDT